MYDLDIESFSLYDGRVFIAQDTIFVTFELMTLDLGNFYKNLSLSQSYNKRIVSHKNNRIKVSI